MGRIGGCTNLRVSPTRGLGLNQRLRLGLLALRLVGQLRPVGRLGLGSGLNFRLRLNPLSLVHFRLLPASGFGRRPRLSLRLLLARLSGELSLSRHFRPRLLRPDVRLRVARTVGTLLRCKLRR